MTHKLISRGVSVLHPQLSLHWFATLGVILIVLFAVVLPLVKLGTGFVGGFTGKYVGAPQTSVSLV